MRSATYVLPVFSLVAVLATAPVLPAHASEPKQAESPKADRCEHGVKKTLCTRCNPKLVPVFKAKGDWCGEHQVAESQCVKCHPELAKEGVK